MMKIIDMRVEWMFGWANVPSLKLLVDRIPDQKEMRFSHPNDWLWIAELDGAVRFYSWTGPKNEGGFGGSCYDLTMQDGSNVQIKGPWSSRAGAVNLCIDKPVVDLAYTDDPEVWKRGHTFYGGDATLELVNEGLSRLLPEVEMFLEVSKGSFSEGERTYIPSLKGKTPEESKKIIEATTPESPLYKLRIGQSDPWKKGTK